MISAPFWDYSGVGPSKGERFLHDVTDSFSNDAPSPTIQEFFWLIIP